MGVRSSASESMAWLDLRFALQVPNWTQQVYHRNCLQVGRCVVTPWGFGYLLLPEDPKPPIRTAGQLVATPPTRRSVLSPRSHAPARTRPQAAFLPGEEDHEAGGGRMARPRSHQI
jgi:hypothetical protein